VTDPSDPGDPGLRPFPMATPNSPFPPLGQGMSLAGHVETPTDWNPQADAHDPGIREHALVTLGRFAFPPAPAPDDEGMAARDRRWTTRAIVFATVLMLVFNAVSIQNWSRQQPPGWVTSTVQQLGDVWAAQVMQLGADRPRQAFRDVWSSFQHTDFQGRDQPGRRLAEPYR